MSSPIAQTAVAPAHRPAVATTGRWFGDPARPLMGWLTTPASGPTTAGVLVLPDVGAQYWSSHFTTRAIAERLAEAGHTVLRMDYDGTGDSAGDQWDPGRVAAWRASAASGAQELRALGCQRLTVVGVRLGAMLALVDGAALQADEVVAWAPESSGKRYGRALRLLGEPIPDDAGVTSGGVVFTPETLDDLSALDMAKIAASPAPSTLLLGDVSAKVVRHLESLGGRVDATDPGGSEAALDRATEDAEAAWAIVDAIAAWVPPPTTAPAAPPAPTGAAAAYDGDRTTATIAWNGRRLTERVVTVTDLVGLLTEPETPRERPCTVVFLNAGSSSHVGPGRAWVEYARFVAAAGHRALRVDWRGWGESPDEGHSPGRPYDRHTFDETVRLVEALRADGHERVVLTGLCASAWMALRVVRDAPVAGVMALNPQMYWQWGDPVLSQVDTGIERTDKRLREEWGRKWKVWTALDVVGHRPPVARWLAELSAARVQVLTLFSEQDDGLCFLHNRMQRRLDRILRKGYVHVEEVLGIDHGMFRAWLRPQMVAAMLRHLERIS